MSDIDRQVEAWRADAERALSVPDDKPNSRMHYDSRRVVVALCERIAELEQLNSDLRKGNLLVYWCNTEHLPISWSEKVDGTPCPLCKLKRELAEARKPRRGDEWHEGDGNVLWFCEPIDEPPYCGSPLDQDFPWVSTNLSDIRWVPLPAIFRMADEQGGEDDE